MALADNDVQTSKRQLGSSSSPTPSASSSSSSGFTSPLNSGADFTCSPTIGNRCDSADNIEASGRMSAASSTTNELDTVICHKPVGLKRATELANTGVSLDSGHTLSESDGNNNRHDTVENSMSTKWPPSGDKLAATNYTSRPTTAELERNQTGLVSGSSSCQSPSSMGSTMNCEAGLLYYNREPLKLKDFCAEVRAPMDVEQFAHQAELMLDLNEVSMDGIIEAMLTKVSSQHHERYCRRLLH